MVDIARLVVRLEAENSKLTKALSKSTKDVKRFDSSVKKAARSARQSFSGLFAGLAAALSVRQVFGVVTSFEKLDAQLETVSGSAEAAAEAMVGIQSIAATVPFSIQEVTDSFIKLKAFGLDPSREALTSYANTASAMGRSLNQVIEAVADAATGEFERLKEFGIKAKSQGDKVTFTFRGISTTVNKTAADIERFVKGVGLNEFAGASARQIDTLSGSLVNLSDQIAIATNSLAKDSGLVDYLKQTATAISEIVAFSQSAEGSLSIIGSEINRLTETQQNLRTELKTTGDADVWDGLYRQLQLVNAQIDVQKQKFQEAIAEKNKLASGALTDSGVTAPPPAATPVSTNVVAAAQQATDEWDIAFAKIDAEFRALDEEWADGFLGLNVTTEQVDELADKTEEATNDMSVFADQAARNMQDSFAQYLFDPFKEDGLKGMLDGFVTTLREMASQAAAAKIFESLGSGLGGSENSFIAGIGSFFSSTTRAAGGPLAAGQASLIGEKGPELFIPSTAGTVVPNNQMGAVTVNVTAPAGRDSQSASQFGFEVARALGVAQRRNG